MAHIEEDQRLTQELHNAQVMAEILLETIETHQESFDEALMHEYLEVLNAVTIAQVRLNNFENR